MHLQPDEVRDWYLAARSVVPEGEWTRDDAWLADRGYVTVSGGFAAISSRIFAPCTAACYAVHPLRGDDGCGRTPAQVGAAPAAPGIYPVLTLQRPLPDAGTAVMTLLQDAQTQPNAPRTPQALAATLARAAPIVLALIRDADTLSVTDAAASYDTGEAVVDVPVASDGPFVIAAWLAPPVTEDCAMQVLAIGACTGPIAERLLAVPLPVDPARLLRLGQPDTEADATSRIQSAAFLNRQQDWDRNRPRALSWTAAAAAAGSPGALAQLAKDDLPFDDAFLDLLERRGRRTIDRTLLARSRDRQAKALRRPIKATTRDRVGARRLARLARHPSRWVRRSVASRMDLPPSVIRILAADPDEYVRWSLTRQAAVPVEI
ncbi:MAG: hypothetical protein ACKOE2_00535, partial [Actinomycetales bacterium]